MGRYGIGSMRVDEKELKEENEKLKEEVEVVEGLFITKKEIKEMEYLPPPAHFSCPTMGRFIKVYRMKFYLFCEFFQDIRTLLREDEYMVGPLFLMVIREKAKAEGEKKEALREICKEFKPTYEKVVEEQKKTINAGINEVKNYIFSEEASEQKEW